MDYNSLQGTIPASFGSLRNLTSLGLSGNNLHGTLPESIGQLSKLSLLDVSSNDLRGTISEAHFSKLSRLKILHLSSNSFVLTVSSNWIPPFQVRNLYMGSCHLGPSFPSWLKSQKEVMYLDFSNASISGSIPNWFWDISSKLSLLNVSLNNLQGRLPDPLKVAPFADVDFSSNFLEGPIPLPIFEIELLDLSNNTFSGQIPEKIGVSLPNLILFSLSSNQISGQIPATIGKMQYLALLDLSGNNLTGTIPSTIGNCSFLEALDLRNNRLVGQIPSFWGQLNLLQTLHLSNNKLIGEIPLSFQNLSSLETLDLGNNRLTGNIPPWVGNGFSNLRILSSRSNAFSGEIPRMLSNLSSLQVLDLAENNLNGSIPTSFGDFRAMIQPEIMNHYLFYGNYRGVYYEDSFVINAKNQQLKYTKTLSLVTSIDLSGNDLDGDFPQDITRLAGLGMLNLSRNHIRGQIPANISSLSQLSSLDLSSNELSGPIPSTISSLSFLGYLNLSNNNLSGMIPHTDHMTTFEASSFGGNPDLCGPPLVVMCKDNRSTDKNGTLEVEKNNGVIDKWFYLSVGVGFAAGILVPFIILSIKGAWSDAYFDLVDKVIDRLSLFTNGRARHHKGRRGLRR